MSQLPPGFDLNQFNAFLDKATQAIACDAECQKQQRRDNLKAKYQDAKTRLSMAEPEFQVAKKNYYTYVAGQTGYNEMMEQELSAKADALVQKLKRAYQEESDAVRLQLDTLDALAKNVANVEELADKYKRENAQLARQLKEDAGEVVTNERRTFYENQQNEALDNYYYYLFLVVYMIAVLGFFVFSLISPGNTLSWKTRALWVALLFALPWMSTWILGVIVWVVYSIINLLPKNVYFGQSVHP